MALTGKEGRHEVKAAKQRLATAKSNASATKSMVESANAVLDAATKHMAEAKVQHEKNLMEIDEAKDYLKEVNKRWEVVDVDDSGSESEDNKSQSVSVDESDGSGEDLRGGLTVPKKRKAKATKTGQSLSLIHI